MWVESSKAIELCKLVKVFQTLKGFMKSNQREDT